VKLADTPQAVLDTAVAAAQLIGDGFYGVDLKQTDAGVFVIEINDNPNLDVGAEDKVLGDEVYRRLLEFLLARFEGRTDAPATPAAPTLARLDDMTDRHSKTLGEIA
jgi:hypothetical protein